MHGLYSPVFLLALLGGLSAWVLYEWRPRWRSLAAPVLRVPGRLLELGYGFDPLLERAVIPGRKGAGQGRCRPGRRALYRRTAGERAGADDSLEFGASCGVCRPASFIHLRLRDGDGDLPADRLGSILVLGLMPDPGLLSVIVWLPVGAGLLIMGLARQRRRGALVRASSSPCSNGYRARSSGAPSSPAAASSSSSGTTWIERFKRGVFTSASTASRWRLFC